MTAPSLVLLGYGSTNPQASQVSHEIRASVLAIRPELDVHVAFLDHCPPTGPQVINKLVRRGVKEVVFVPLLLSDAFKAEVDVPAMIAKVQAAHPGLQVIASRPIGPDAQLLSIVDRRLRDVLRRRRISELDALIFASAGSSDVRSNAIVARRARQWATHHRLPCLTAFASVSGPSTAEAVRSLRAQGRRHIAVGSWFLTPGTMYTRQAELAYEAGAIAVSDPLGAEPEIAQAALGRYVVAAIDLVDLEPVLDEEPAPTRHLTVVGA